MKEKMFGLFLSRGISLVGEIVIKMKIVSKGVVKDA